MKYSQFMPAGKNTSETALNPVRSPLRKMARKILVLPEDQQRAEIERLEKGAAGNAEAEKGLSLLKKMLR